MKPRWNPNANAGRHAFRWAIIGYGNVAVAHTEGIAEADMHLVGFSTSKSHIRQGDATGLTFNIGETKGRMMDVRQMLTFSNPEDLLSHLYTRADGVIVCAPTDKHVEIVRMVGVTGLNCLVEKPIAGSSKDALDMIKFYDHKRGGLLCGQILPCFTEFDILRQRVLEKGVENVVSLTMQRFIPWSSTDDEAKTVAAGGWMRDLLVHDAHMVASFGSPKSVFVSDAVSRYDCIQYAKMTVNLGKSSGYFNLEGGASRHHESFYHGYTATFADGTNLNFDGKTVWDNHGSIEIPAMTVGQVWAKELQIAASYFRGEGDGAFLSPVMAMNALKILEAAERSVASGEAEEI